LKKKVANASINLVDNPLLKRGLGSRLFDGEGLGTSKQTLIQDGVLQQWLLDLSSAKQLNLKPTGNAKRGISGPPSPGTTNLTLMNGKETPEELISNVKDGLYITDMIGSSISMVTGDYSRGASGFWIKKWSIITTNYRSNYCW
jgi:PmbA protein